MASAPHHNANPDVVFSTVEDLRREATRLNRNGDRFIDYLLEGDYSQGKGVWINDGAQVRDFYRELLEADPHLACESPFGSYFRSNGIRERGDNRIMVRNLRSAPPDYRAILEAHQRKRTAGETPPIAVFAGGPAAKIAGLLCALPAMRAKTELDVRFVLDGAERKRVREL